MIHLFSSNVLNPCINFNKKPGAVYQRAITSGPDLSKDHPLFKSYLLNIYEYNEVNCTLSLHKYLIVYSSVHYFLLFIAGLAAGVISTLAGGGSFISLSALILMGVPSVAANGTNRISVLFQTVSGTAGFKSKGVYVFPYSVWLGLAAVPGAVIGAEFAVRISDDMFNRLLAIFMVIFVILMVVDTLRNSGSLAERTGKKYRITGMITFFFLGIYGGFIQSGMGFLVILALRFIHHFNLTKTNSIKVVIILIQTIAALAIFFWSASIYWQYGLILGAGAATGGWLSSRWSIQVDEKIIRYIILAAILGLAIRIWFF